MTVAVRVALFSMSCASVVLSVVAAAARLSRYPSSFDKASEEMESSVVYAEVTALAAPKEGGRAFPAASNCRLRAM